MTIDASSLTVDVTEGERWRRTLSVKVPAGAVTEERAKIAQKLAGRMKLPGFRSGKIPSSVVEKRFGASLNREVLDQVVGDAYKQALAMRDLKPISEGEIQELNWEPEQDLVFSISFDVEPAIELSRISGFKAQRPKVEVGEEEVDRVVERLREQNGAWAPAEEGKVEDGELASITVTRLEEGEAAGEPQDYDLIVGEGDAIPDVEEAIRTLAPGEEEVFTVSFPDDFPNEERRGDQEVLRILVRERKIRELPDADDAFARSVGDFEDLAALTSRIREDLEKEAEQQAENVVRGQLLEFIMEANPFEVPVSMVNRYLDSMLGRPEGVDEEALARAREQLGSEGEKAVRRILIVEHLAEAHGLTATDDDVDARVEAIAQGAGTDVSKVYAQLQKAGRIEQIERELTEKKVFEFLKEQSTIQDAE
ncbi:MAG: trigger factor [Gemmatimonadales bacterium]|nr:MAG: trigger factor [Gemmatimonadales bacterium]